MTVTIHQPNFLPWYPFFEKVQQADLFILLGNCQFEKNGYQNRFQYNNEWNTLSVQKGLVSIKEKHYINANKDWNKIKLNLKHRSSILSEMDSFIVDSLYETNKSIIQYLMKRLSINTPLVEDYPTDLKSSERLLDLCKHYGATTYLAGQGGLDYLDVDLFQRNGIKVIYQDNLTKIHTLDVL
jgi:hypothetical protein